MEIYYWTCEHDVTGEEHTVTAPDADWPKGDFYGSCAEAIFDGCGITFDHHDRRSPVPQRGSVAYKYSGTVEQWIADERDGALDA